MKHGTSVILQRREHSQLRSQTLMIDADDTLWKNNVYFERSMRSFIALLQHPSLAAHAVRDIFNSLERERVRLHGYGAKSFGASMLACFRLLRSRDPEAHEQAEIVSLAESILHAEIELLDDVAETLPYLASRHRLILVTKGDPEEQMAKLQRSGLAEHFHHVEVLYEKHTKAFLQLYGKHACEAASTWMIGNSPRSDINPALAAGLHAVFVPHGNSWILEDEPLGLPHPGRQLLQVPAFQHLADLF